MVDKVNPTNQFHPYQSPDELLGTSSSSGMGNTTSKLGGLGAILGKVGLGGMKNMDVRGSLDKVRGVARNNGAVTLGSLAAIAIGAGLLRRRAMTRAARTV